MNHAIYSNGFAHS